MGRIWRDGKLVGVIGGDADCRSGCVFPTDDDEPFGFRVGAAECKGISQNFLGIEKLVRADPSDKTLVLGADKRVYEERYGLIRCLAPTKPPSGEPNVYVEDIDWGRFPPEDQLAWLFFHFFYRYTDREVVILVGQRRDGSGWLYYVPEQVGTYDSVKWTTDDEEMDWFQERAQWIGTIHSHPGNCCKPSQTDVDDWAEPEKSGLHVVFGRDGSYTVNGAVAERTFELDAGRVHKGIDWVGAGYCTSKHRNLAELLKRPKPVATRTVRRGVISTIRASKRPWRYTHEEKHTQPLWDSETGLPLWRGDEENDKDFVKETLDVIGALPLMGKDDGIPVLRIVEYDGQFHALTLSQYAELVEWCRDVCPVPKLKRLRLYGTRGSKR